MKGTRAERLRRLFAQAGHQNATLRGNTRTFCVCMSVSLLFLPSLSLSTSICSLAHTVFLSEIRPWCTVRYHAIFLFCVFPPQTRHHTRYRGKEGDERGPNAKVDTPLVPIKRTHSPPLLVDWFIISCIPSFEPFLLPHPARPVCIKKTVLSQSPHPFFFVLFVSCFLCLLFFSFLILFTKHHQYNLNDKKQTHHVSIQERRDLCPSQRSP